MEPFSGISLNYERNGGKLAISISGASYDFSGVCDSEIMDYLGYAIGIHETGTSPFEAGMIYDSIEDKPGLLSFLESRQAESEEEEKKVSYFLERINKATERIFSDPKEIEERMRFARRLGRLSPEDYLRPIGIHVSNKREETYNKIMEMKKDFDKPIPDEVIDEIEHFSRKPQMEPEDWLKTFI